MVGADGVEVLTLPGMEGAVANAWDEAQVNAEAARRVFQSSGDYEAWMDDYFDLVGQGWSWRQAVYLIWAAQPKEHREPKTQEALAIEVLGLTSDRIIREWRREIPGMEMAIRKLTVGALADSRADVLAALVQSATEPTYRNYRDRELFLKLTGDYVPQTDVNVRAGTLADVEKMDAAELAVMAEIPGTVDGRR